MHTPSSHHNAWQPVFTSDQLAHAARVRAHIETQLAAAGGWLDFAQFMALALYAPGLGYYSAGAHKIGAAGDFITAPEVSPLFARCLARQTAEVLRHTGGSVLELGAGSGAMAAEMWLQLAREGIEPEHYFILEVSADLRQRQREHLTATVPQFVSRCVWLDQLPDSFTGVMVANEVLDALPVSRFVKAEDDIHALGVALDQDRFVWQSRPASPALNAAVKHLQTSLGVEFPAGYVGEIDLQLPGWLASMAQSLSRGVMLLIDYGYPRQELYSHERRQGTLSCFCQHRRHDDPLIHVGLQDITAWVDFTAVAEAADACGLQVSGFATQAHFLMAAGLPALLAEIETGDETQRWRLSQQVQRLTLPNEMGETFKVMALSRAHDEPLGGFTFRDLRHRL